MPEFSFQEFLEAELARLPAGRLGSAAPELVLTLNTDASTLSLERGWYLTVMKGPT